MCLFNIFVTFLRKWQSLTLHTQSPTLRARWLKRSLLTFIREVPGSNLERDTEYHDCFLVVSQSNITTGYWTDRVRFSAGEINFSVLYSIQSASGSHPVSYPKGTGVSFHGGKAAGA
jgi:hypothetical protein